MPNQPALANACTDCTTPLRVRNVPNTHSEYASPISAKFQIFSIPRFSWIITEWRNAVPASQGMSEEFSTGSQPQ